MTDQTTRRYFLGQTAMAGAALATMSATRALRAADAPANKVVVAIMGTNGRGSALARGFAAQPGVEVAYICDPDQQAIEKGVQAVGPQAAGEQSMPLRGVQDFRRALDDPRVDAMVIATPDHWHAPATILACSANKHVYVEKPACHNGHEGELMVSAARKHQRIVQLGTQRRSAPGLHEAIQRLHAGEIGRLLLARGWINSIRPGIGHGKPAAPPATLDYSLWQGPSPETPYRDNVIHYHWHWFWHWGTGELGNNGIHALDVCRWGMGVEYPRQVVCAGGKFHFQDDQETPDTQLATFHFGDKAIHWEHRTWSKQGIDGESFGATFYGESGTMQITGSSYKMFDLEGKLVAEGAAPYNDAEHIGNFLSAIRGGTGLNAEIEEGVKSTALCHLGNIAYRVGRTVHFDPNSRQIVDDTEAAGLWHREYRSGWEPQV